MPVSMKGVYTKEPVDISKSKGFVIAMRNDSNEQSPKVVIRAYNNSSNYLYDTATLYNGLAPNCDHKIGSGMVCYIKLGSPGVVTIRFELEVGGEKVQTLYFTTEGAVYEPRFQIQNIRYEWCKSNGVKGTRKYAGGKTKFSVTVKNVGLVDGRNDIKVYDSKGQLLDDSFKNLDVGEEGTSSIYFTIDDPGNHEITFQVEAPDGRVHDFRENRYFWSDPVMKIDMDSFSIKQGATEFKDLLFKNGTKVKSYGCAVCSVAMIICYKLGITDTATKVEVVKKVIADASDAKGNLSYKAPITFNGKTFTAYTDWGANKDIVRFISDNEPIVCHHPGHFVVVDGYDPSTPEYACYSTQDPGSNYRFNLQESLDHYGESTFSKLIEVR